MDTSLTFAVFLNPVLALNTKPAQAVSGIQTMTCILLKVTRQKRTFVSVQNEQFSRCSWMERGWQKSRPTGATSRSWFPPADIKPRTACVPSLLPLEADCLLLWKGFRPVKEKSCFPVRALCVWRWHDLKKNVKHVLCVFHWPPHVSSTSPAVGREEAKKRKTLRPEGVA